MADERCTLFVTQWLIHTKRNMEYVCVIGFYLGYFGCFALLSAKKKTIKLDFQYKLFIEALICRLYTSSRCIWMVNVHFCGKEKFD